MLCARPASLCLFSLLLVGENALAQEHRDEVATAKELAERFKKESSHSYSILDDNPLFDLDTLGKTEVKSQLIERPKKRDLFQAKNQLDAGADYSMRIEHRPMDGLTLHSDSRLGVESRYQGEDLLWGDSDETYQRVQEVGARVQPIEAFSLGARYEIRSQLPQGDETVLERDRRILEGSLKPWSKSTLTLGMENHTASDWSTDEMMQDQRIYRSEWKQGVADLPITTTLGARLTEDYDPDMPAEFLQSSTPQFSGAVDWIPADRVNLRLGARGQQREDSFGEQVNEQHHIFAEYKHGLTESLEWRSRVTFEDSINYLNGATSSESNKAEMRVGPSWKMGDHFNADLELFRSWEENTATPGWEPGESRVSFSIRGEF